jgi:glycosyltransferase involved in cell wall biosynthesis
VTEETTTVLMSSDSGGNPYQSLLCDALRAENVDIVLKEFSLIFPLTVDGVLDRSIDAVHLDWLYQFYMSTPMENKLLNTIITVFRAVVFIIDLFVLAVSGTQLVWTVHNTYHHERKFQRTERVVNELTFLAADTNTVKCPSAGRILSREYTMPRENMFSIIRDGNYNAVYPNNVSKKEARDKLSVEEDSFVFLFFGKIREYKGVDVLIDAFQNLSYDNMNLWVVGNPESERLRSDLQKQTDSIENITIELEFISEDSVQLYLNMADVLVLPYRRILNSGSIYLALTFGLPVIAPEMGCIPCSVPSENEELLYNGSQKGLIQSLEIAYLHSDLSRISEANRRQAEDYDWTTPAKQLAKIYRGN